jgi:xanthine dehydrogenase YagS FAD-binding subunit
MKRLRNANARTLGEAVVLARRARDDGARASYAGGGSDLLGMVKERIEDPDLVVSLKMVVGHDQVETTGDGVRIGGLITLDTLSRHQLVRDRFAVLAQAADTVATPQIRNVGTLAGNVSQRPWCWYYRRGFDCYKAGGTQCFSATGENQFHAIFGGGPSYIVHPSDTAVALVALDATFRLVGPSEDRSVPAAQFFVLPSANPARENVLREDELLVGVELPAPATGARSAYHKVMDRESWTHAVVSAAVVLDLEGEVCRGARIVLGGVAPTPWRVPAAEQVLVGNRVTAALAARAADVALEGARPLSKNGYKVALTKAVVERTLVDLLPT